MEKRLRIQPAYLEDSNEWQITLTVKETGQTVDLYFTPVQLGSVVEKMRRAYERACKQGDPSLDYELSDGNIVIELNDTPLSSFKEMVEFASCLSQSNPNFIVQ
jgi:hypothetical protein